MGRLFKGNEVYLTKEDESRIKCLHKIWEILRKLRSIVQVVVIRGFLR
jgi:hypothetical protein